jgi:prephenate dehydrogenase
MTDDTISSARICIVGLGLMGGSLAMDLKNSCRQLYGIDKNAEAVAFALEHDLLDSGSTCLEELIPRSDVIILAVPVNTIIELIPQIPELHPGKAIVIDLGSTKKEILAAYEELPLRFDPIGAHPMCGKENLTITNADAGLFTNAPFAFTPLQRTTEKARNFAEQLTMLLGARLIWIDAETHDSWVAATSHLPFLISMALALATPREAVPLVGPGFRSMVRLASTPGSMMVDILRSNRTEILNAGTAYLSKLSAILDLLEGSDFDRLAELIEEGRVKKDKLAAQHGN